MCPRYFLFIQGSSGKPNGWTFMLYASKETVVQEKHCYQYTFCTALIHLFTTFLYLFAVTLLS